MLCGALLTHFDIFSLETRTSKVVAPDLISCSSHVINLTPFARMSVMRVSVFIKNKPLGLSAYETSLSNSTVIVL